MLVSYDLVLESYKIVKTLQANLRINNFIKKIKDEVGFKTIDGKSLKFKGNIEVAYDGFIIDGIKFRPEEFHRLISSYEGFVLEYK